MASTANLVMDGEFPSYETPLQTSWTFWFDKKIATKNGTKPVVDTSVEKKNVYVQDSNEFANSLKVLGTFNTIESFYAHYSHLKRPSELSAGLTLYAFRYGLRPMWEEFPDGGCWILRIKKNTAGRGFVNKVFERLLLALVGEQFCNADVCGIVASIRYRDDIISVWNADNEKYPESKILIGDKIRSVLDLDENTLLQYKEHKGSLQDHSSYRNARNYVFTEADK